MSGLTYPVAYLEPDDFTASGNLKNVKNKTCVVMVQATWCGACTSAKPEFQSFAELADDVLCLTIEDDGEDPKREHMLGLVKKLKPSFEGFPDYLLFENGKCVPKTIKGRSVHHLMELTDLV
jgi:thiol-disulfide isomerase/thioredoxin